MRHKPRGLSLIHILLGSLNAASFMSDYANFGFAGISVSTILTALLFCLVTIIYRDHPLALPLNIPLILVSMETSIITALNSGAGWLAMTALFLSLIHICPNKDYTDYASYEKLFEVGLKVKRAFTKL